GAQGRGASGGCSRVARRGGGRPASRRAWAPATGAAIRIRGSSSAVRCGETVTARIVTTPRLAPISPPKRPSAVDSVRNWIPIWRGGAAPARPRPPLPPPPPPPTPPGWAVPPPPAAHPNPPPPRSHEQTVGAPLFSHLAPP